jgi:hypothetical protein
MSVLQYLMADNANNIAAVSMPVWAYKKNGLWLETLKIMKMMHSFAFLDLGFDLLFEDKCVFCLHSHL